MEKVLSAERGAPRRVRRPSPPPLFIPSCGTTRLQRVPEGERESRLEPESLAGCKSEEKNSLRNPSPALTRPDKDYISLLNQRNNALKPLTSSAVFNRITRRRQCD